jgi:hypothetical protein
VYIHAVTKLLLSYQFTVMNVLNIDVEMLLVALRDNLMFVVEE